MRILYVNVFRGATKPSIHPTPKPSIHHLEALTTLWACSANNKYNVNLDWSAIWTTPPCDNSAVDDFDLGLR